ncbi:MAG: hypothetical protein L0H57_12425 [Yaniella sp.]|nr:hypothetical protein [Yaniella sp.]
MSTETRKHAQKGVVTGSHSSADSKTTDSLIRGTDTFWTLVMSVWIETAPASLPNTTIPECFQS